MELIQSILKQYGIDEGASIKQIHRSAWLVNGNFVLKRNSEQGQAEKSIAVNRHLGLQGIPVAKYISTLSGERCFINEGIAYTLMHKLNGEHYSPLEGDYLAIARSSGHAIAQLHKALSACRCDIIIVKSDLPSELKGWVAAEIAKKSIEIPHNMHSTSIDLLRDYHRLPRQAIHRDLHFGNMLFENNKLCGFLDFDISSENARMFDIAYFLQSILVDKYTDLSFVARWREFCAAFFLSYRSQNPLLDVEISSFFSLCLAIQLIFIAYFSSVGSIDLVPGSIAMAEWVLSNREAYILL